ncbi:MAG: hypothetical protein NXI24_09515 [bacterium]|nr:hypothetical protein [bacterium]
MKSNHKSLIQIGHQDGPLRYEVASAILTCRELSPDYLQAWLEVRAKADPSSPMERLGPPNFNLDGFVIPRGRGRIRLNLKDSENYRMYMAAHDSLFNNRIGLEIIAPDRVWIDWSCSSEDINYYDDRAADNDISIRCVAELIRDGYFEYTS